MSLAVTVTVTGWSLVPLYSVRSVKIKCVPLLAQSKSVERDMSLSLGRGREGQGEAGRGARVKGNFSFRTFGLLTASKIYCLSAELPWII